ncbi:MAG TPA: protein kinase [Silvibacterium sp.]|nr:protein kinase [Silvibacterium sp.]
MIDPKKRTYEQEAPTILVSRNGTATQTPAPVSTNEFSGFSEAPFELDGSLATLAPPPATPARLTGDAPGTSAGSTPGGMRLEPGIVLANRYEIIEILGEGGMGAVYKARDLELAREVALKVIRPELASNPEILQRFKQELILARQVSDRNVIRIFDLGETGKIKFITMEYVEGKSLDQLLKQLGKLRVEEAVDIMEQAASGLAAIHREGIIHRDLKPGNIMRDKNGRVAVMDFGLARSLVGDGMTQTGAMLGTIEYMSPEQAQGKELTASSDIFTVGLILYQLLSGTIPFHAESVIASLLMRAQQRAIPLADIDKQIPGILSNIVSKCLETDPARRYQNAEALLSDIQAWKGKRGKSKISASSASLRMNRIRELPWLRFAITAVLIVLTASGFFLYLSSRQQAGKALNHAPVSVLVADFQNNTGDSLFDDTLEPMFNVALEGASFINGFSRGTARTLAGGLPNSTQRLDEQTSRLVGVKEGIAAIVTGSLSKRGSGYSLSVNAIDALTGKTLASAKVVTANKDALLLEVPRLAVPIRQALGDTTPKSVQLTAAQGTFSTDSLEAVHQYSIGMEHQFKGQWADALQSFSKAAQLDPNFARAYAGMAAAAGNIGQLQDAEKYAKLAMEHVDRMTERERYRVRGQYYIWTENWQKCTEEYGELVKQYPADNIGHSNLAACYARLLDMPKAMEEARRGLEITPNDVLARMNFALYACYATDFLSCEKGAKQVLELNPAYEEAFLVLAYAQLGQGQLPQASETYQKMQGMSAWGSSLAASGFGDLSLYVGDFRKGARTLETGAAQDLAAGKPGAAADKLIMLAYANLLRGDKESAVAAAERALTNSQSIKIRFLAARAFIEAGEIAKAQKLAADLASEIQASPQAYAKLILGEIALYEHNPKNAIQQFTEAKDLSDTWLGRFDLGRAYLEAGAFIEADSEFDRCIQRRGEALELFMDDVPTYSYLPLVYYYQGQAREGLKSPEFAGFYSTYLGIRGQSTEDPLVPEIRRHLHQ